jgi:hypothetical protein
LNNPKIPHTTNGIEGFFSHLKNHLDLHRGLTLGHRINFIKWYVYLSNDKRVFQAIRLTKKSRAGQTNDQPSFFV